MSKYTEGPWKWTETELNTDTHQDLIQADLALGEGDSILHHGADWPIDEANARLIAAAPELLDLVQRIKRHLDGGGSIQPENGIHIAIRANIAKATE